MCNLSDAIFALGEQRGEQRGIQIGEQRGIQIGEVKGKEAGQHLILMLMQQLFTAGRYDDAQRATVDGEFCVGLLQEFNLVWKNNLNQ